MRPPKNRQITKIKLDLHMVLAVYYKVREMIKIKEKSMSLNILVLESVGSCIDTAGIVYPMNVDNTPDTNCGVDWLDTTDEWNESLSEEDAGLLDEWLLENNYSVDINDPGNEINN
tara:strand:+ start:96 stop:443 length:348 start_codon:yes stop_codon:yes gene_type:complete